MEQADRGKDHLRHWLQGSLFEPKTREWEDL